MNQFKIGDLRVGFNAEFRVHVYPGTIDLFQSLTGDWNPLHSSESFAQTSGFKARVAHGMLTAGYYSRLVGHYLPGENALLHRADVSFVSPVFEEDDLLVRGEVVAINESVAQVEIKAQILRDGVRVSRAKLWVGIRA
jgi:acyl dehydratase